MKLFSRFTIVWAIAVVAGIAPAPIHAEVDDGVIRLRPGNSTSGKIPAQEQVRVEEPRRGFDYESFEGRLESLWFQRKTFLADRRHDDAANQLEQIRALSVEEGVKRLENVAGALVSESRRHLAAGNYAQAGAALNYAEAFDPGRPQIHSARATVHWQSDRRVLHAARELVLAGRASIGRALSDLSLFHQLGLVLGAAAVLFVAVFSVLMLVRYQVQFRHEVGEWIGHVASPWWGKLAGWTFLLLPFVTWIAAGWAAIYWIAIMFRFMRRSERITAVTILLMMTVSLPAYQIVVNVYGTTAHPAVRTTLASAAGEYDPDRIVRLRQLVEAHPEDPVYRFLLAGLYRNGRFFQEGFLEYKTALELDPSLWQIHINIGNIFYTTGQYEEAIANYHRALQLEPASVLAHFNLHLAQSEAFRFRAAEESLTTARRIDSKRVSRLLTGAGSWGDRPLVQDATLEMSSVWQAALGGRSPARSSGGGDASAAGPGWWIGQLVHPIPIVSVLALLACGVGVLLTREHHPARRCIRCGLAFCHHCKSSREAQEYCTQCLHLYVLGDGLAPGAKHRKVYEVERYERLVHLTRRLSSVLLPGAAHLMRGKAGRGSALLLFWFAALIALAAIILPLGTVAGIDLERDLLGSGEVPAIFRTHPLAVLGLTAIPLIWCLGNLWRMRRTET